MPTRMRILTVCAEYAPFAKVGGLADVVSGLSRVIITNGEAQERLEAAE